jgi:hypothetical protein
LISLETKKPFVSLPKQRQVIDIQQNFHEYPYHLGNEAGHLSSKLVKTQDNSLKSLWKRLRGCSRRIAENTALHPRQKKQTANIFHVEIVVKDIFPSSAINCPGGFPCPR